MEAEEELSIWKSIKDGDSKAFDTLFSNYFDYLYKYGFTLSQDDALIKDSIQDVFLELWSKKNRISIRSSVKYYLLSSFRRTLFSKFKLNKSISLEAQHHNVLKADSAHSSIEEKEEAEIIRFKLGKMAELLTPRQREAIFLKFYEGMDSVEISELMHIDIKAVYKLISTGIMRYRKNLKIN